MTYSLLSPAMKSEFACVHRRSGG